MVTSLHVQLEQWLVECLVDRVELVLDGAHQVRQRITDAGALIEAVQQQLLEELRVCRARRASVQHRHRLFEQCRLAGVLLDVDATAENVREEANVEQQLHTSFLRDAVPECHARARLTSLLLLLLLLLLVLLQELLVDSLHTGCELECKEAHKDLQSLYTHTSTARYVNETHIHTELLAAAAARERTLSVVCA